MKKVLKMKSSRRSFLISSSAFIAASPAIVRAASLVDYISSRSYGLVGDGVTNDYAAMQAFLNDLGSTGGTGILVPGEYYISGGDPKLDVGHGIPTTELSAYGARILTDPTQPRTGLTITRNAAAGHNDGPRKVVVNGLQIDHFGDPSAVAGICIQGALYTGIHDCIITAGGNGAGPSSNENYQAIAVNQSNPHDGSTGSYLTRIENTSITGGAVKVPAGVVLYGQDNGSSIVGCSFLSVNNSILFYADADGNIANGVTANNNAFESCDQCVMFACYVPGYTALHGFKAAYNRVEDCGTFLYYRLNVNASVPPVLGPNSFISTGPIYNPNSLTIVNY